MSNIKHLRWPFQPTTVSAETEPWIKPLFICWRNIETESFIFYITKPHVSSSNMEADIDSGVYVLYDRVYWLRLGLHAPAWVPVQGIASSNCALYRTIIILNTIITA
jgi:hypothetical protein